jgi:hypothetical protein
VRLGDEVLDVVAVERLGQVGDLVVVGGRIFGGARPPRHRAFDLRRQLVRVGGAAGLGAGGAGGRNGQGGQQLAHARVLRRQHRGLGQHQLRAIPRSLLHQHLGQPAVSGEAAGRLGDGALEGQLGLVELAALIERTAQRRVGDGQPGLLLHDQPAQLLCLLHAPGFAERVRERDQGDQVRADLGRRRSSARRRRRLERPLGHSSKYYPSSSRGKVSRRRKIVYLHS